ncbi:putative GPI-anchored protein pfl2 [Colossoma macropomum]|uniref:putative GPI-anchored protein pfl2 n=1 Tax=Colossoma macropomum TaxID=42526 RepID=UPI0018649602|nr:putative GPI-anchored protein pfl2 [Colossoma macropomum]
MSFSINETFNDNLSNSSSDQFKAQADKITVQLERLYKRLFRNFLRMIIRAFRKGSIVADITLEFSSSNSSTNATQLSNTLAQAVRDGNVTLAIDTNSINVTQNPVSTSSDTTTPAVSAATTQASTVATSASTQNASSASTQNATSASTQNATSASTQNATASASTTATVVAATFNVSFRINENFDTNLSNSSSDQFKAKASNITSQFGVVFKRIFKSFIRMFIRSFRSGSIVADSAVEFSTNETTAEQLKNTIIAAIRNGSFTFAIDETSVAVSSGISVAPGMICLLPVLLMSLLSRLL